MTSVLDESAVNALAVRMKVTDFFVVSFEKFLISLVLTVFAEL